MSDDRKYRQRGYQDGDARDRDRARGRTVPGGAQAPRPARRERGDGPRTPNMPGFKTIVRCHRCGVIVTSAILVTTSCAKCGSALHSCAQCSSFNPAARFECSQPIKARIAPKDAFNTCDLFDARTRVERETGSTQQSSARSAFDDLFKI
ncbi:MAG: hypothetical protein AB1806_15865 [Acidobacteriota bacterium]